MIPPGYEIHVWIGLPPAQFTNMKIIPMMAPARPFPPGVNANDNVYPKDEK
jgi:hypothetical protein